MTLILWRLPFWTDGVTALGVEGRGHHMGGSTVPRCQPGELGGAFKFLRFHESLTVDITSVVYVSTLLTPVVFPLLKLLQD